MSNGGAGGAAGAKEGGRVRGVPVGEIAGVAVEVEEGGGGRGARLGDEPGVDADAVGGDDVGVRVAHRVFVWLLLVAARGQGGVVEQLLLEDIQGGQDGTHDRARRQDEGVKEIHGAGRPRGSACRLGEGERRCIVKPRQEDMKGISADGRFPP